MLSRSVLLHYCCRKVSCCITGSYRRVILLHHICLPKRVCYCTLYLQRRVSCCRAAKNCLQKSFLQRHCYQGMSCCITITYRQSGLLQYCYAKKSTLKTYFYLQCLVIANNYLQRSALMRHWSCCTTAMNGRLAALLSL